LTHDLNHDTLASTPAALSAQIQKCKSPRI
jgi:hypothetical protein